MVVSDISTEHYVRINGLDLHYVEWGSTNNKPLLLLHGITGNTHNWDSIAPQLAQTHRVIALDCRGHGNSEWTKAGYWASDFARDIYEFARKLDIAPFDALGHSLGARNLIAFAGDHSDTLDRLILSDNGPELPREGARNVNRNVVGRPTFFRSLVELKNYFKEANPTWTEERIGQQIKNSMRINWAGKYVSKNDPEVMWITGSTGLKEVPYLWAQCAKITCNTLILRGEVSAILSPEIAKKMLSMMSNAKEVVIKGASHNLMQDAPLVYEKAIQAFLRP